jgi:hypothetical protein
MMLLGGAKLEVPIDVPAHVVSERTGGATVMSGLRPGAVAPDGTVASLKSGVATVLLGVSRGTGLPTKALVSVALLAREAGTELPTKELLSVGPVVLAREAASVMVAVGLQMLDVVIVPNGNVIGSDGTKGGELTEGLKGPTEDDGDAIKAAFADATLAAAGLVGPMIVVGHIVIDPSDAPGKGANMPR